MQVTKLDVMSLRKEDVSVKFVDDMGDQSETLSVANNLKHVKNVKASGGKGEKLVGNKLSKLIGAKGEKEVIPPKQEKSSAVAAPKQEKSLAMAAPKQEKSSAVAAPKQEKSSAVAAPKQEKSSAVAAPKQEKSSVVAAVPATVLSTPKLEDEEDSAVCLIKADKNNSPKVEKAAMKVEKPIVEHGTPPLSSKERSKKKRSELATLHQMITLTTLPTLICISLLARLRLWTSITVPGLGPIRVAINNRHRPRSNQTLVTAGTTHLLSRPALVTHSTTKRCRLYVDVRRELEIPVTAGFNVLMRN
uniref:Uncharacterized protein n=1 Tax=Timema genevievae TaxID=629358 RepID=A0A7R9K4V6_TIMGE|nr:unnamed protein product [Timema genevievae]